MPKYSRSRLTSRRLKRKAGYRRRKARVRKTLTVNRALQPFAQRYITKMKYSDTFTLNLANGNTFYFNLNDIYDPSRTGTGHQPYGHDTMQTLYNRYRVIACSWNLTFYSGGSVVRVATIPLNELLSNTNVSAVCEMPRAKWAIQVPGGNTKMIKGKSYLPSLMGRNKTQYMDDDRYQAQYGSSPSELAVLGIVGADNADQTATIQCTITLNYTVESFDPKILAQS